MQEWENVDNLIHVTFERLNKLKEEKQATIPEIAEATKIGIYTLKNYFTKEESIKKMSTTNLYLIAKYFGVTVEYLMGSSDVKSRIFICPDGDRFTPTDPVYHFACEEFVEYLKNKGFVVEEIKE
jgi:transcriptional regulator with XRE-family HTH domain